MSHSHYKSGDASIDIHLQQIKILQPSRARRAHLDALEHDVIGLVRAIVVKVSHFTVLLLRLGKNDLKL